MKPWAKQLAISIAVLFFISIPESYSQQTNTPPLSPELKALLQANGEQLTQKIQLVMQQYGDPNLPDLAEAPSTPEEIEFYRFVATLIDSKELSKGFSGDLRPALAYALKHPKIKAQLPSYVPEEMLRRQLEIFLSTEPRLRGMTQDSKGAIYTNWNDLSNAILERARAASPLGTSEFIRELSLLAGEPFVPARDVEALIDGPASFAKRRALIQGAKKSISILSWSYHDDNTGKSIGGLLVEKAKQGVAVKILVDGETAKRKGYHAYLDALTKHGIQVIKWFGPRDKLYLTQHRKIMIVDAAHVIAGGMNFGDYYSHEGDAGVPKWRDTDLYAQGLPAIRAELLFQKVWNQQIKSRPELKKPQPYAFEVPEWAQAEADFFKKNPSRGYVLLIENEPEAAKTGKAHILEAIIRTIYATKTSLLIENAYLITSPAFDAAIADAIARGVKVQILGNSVESLDEPIIAGPMMKCMRRLKALGAEVYMKKGKDTLHSKFLVADGIFSMVGSYNLHPRSHRLEGEAVLAVTGKKAASELAAAFARDISPENAYAIQAPEDVPVIGGAFAGLAIRIFYDQL